MFNWDHYIEIAERILLGKGIDSNELKDAFCRTAVSRAYYGAFCSARNYLRDYKGLEIPQVGVHTWVREEFNNAKTLEEKKISEKLKELFQKRILADYDDRAIVQERAVKFCLRIAREVMDILNKLKNT